MIPAKRNFVMPGINVDIRNSNGTIVILRDVNMDSEGRYKCEVSAEWPKYNTADKSATMEVLVIPKSKPEIYGASQKYQLGDPVSLTCVSKPSKPRATLMWYINDKQAPPENLEKLNPRRLNNKLEQSQLTLKFQVTRRHFVNGKLTFRCLAQISPVPHKNHSVSKEITFNVSIMGTKDMSGFPGYNGAPQNRKQILKTSIIMVTGIIVQSIWLL